MGLSWCNEILKKWQAGIAHTFLLHGNTGDTVSSVDTVQSFLTNNFKLCYEREIVIQYDRSSGITFPLASHRAAFYKAIDMDVPEDDYDLDLPRDPVGALRLIERVLPLTMEVSDGIMPKTALIMPYAETVAPANDVSAMSSEDRTVLVTLQRWARDLEFAQTGPPIFLITENLSDINPVLRGASSRMETIEIPYPNLEERLAYINSFAGCQNVKVNNVKQAAAMTAGLKCIHLEDIILRAKSLGVAVQSSLIKTRKDEIVRAEFAEVLELMDPEYGFEVIGGMKYVKDFFYRNIINPIKSGNLRRVPLGVLLPGPPGTGKTALAQCVSKESSLNCASLNLSKIFNQWVGSSERNLDKAFTCLEALAPCIVIVDELDQSGLSRENSGDSGVSNRLFKRLLEFMSDVRHRGKIIFIGLTNRPDLIDPALKRPGRFDRKIPILPPDEEERQEIFKVMFSKYNIAYKADMADAAAKTEDYTGAEIEALVLKSLEVAEDAGSGAVMNEHMAHALEAYVPTTRDIQQQVRLALAECNDRDLLPPAYRKMLDERKNSKPAPTMRTVRSLN